MSLPVINNFGLSNTLTAGTYRNLTKIGADTYPTSNSTTQDSQPHFWQPQNKLENYLANANTELRITVSTGATTLLTRQLVASSWTTSVTDIIIRTQCGASGCYTGSTGATQLYYVDLGPLSSSQIDTSFRQFFSLDRFYDSAQSGLTNGGSVTRTKTQRIRIDLAPFTQLALCYEGVVDTVFYNRWDPLYEMVVPDNLSPELTEALAVNRDFWFFNFNYVQPSSPTVLENTAWIYLQRQIAGEAYIN